MIFQELDGDTIVSKRYSTIGNGLSGLQATIASNAEFGSSCASLGALGGDGTHVVAVGAPR